MTTLKQAILALTVAASSLGCASSKLAITPANPVQLKNSTLHFTASINGEPVDGPVSWSSSNPAVATIAGTSGLAQATLLSTGTTTITAAHGGQQVSTLLTVTVAVSPFFSAQPTDTNVSAIINPAGGVRIQLLDNLGSPLAGQQICVTIGANPPALTTPSFGKGTLSGTLTQTTNASGIATFSDLKIDWLGTGYTLIASANPSSGPVLGTSAGFNELRAGDPCLGPAPLQSCPDADGDGLPDAWEKAGGIDFNGDGLITDPQHDLLLPAADPNQPDVFVRYDWMDYGPMETACNVDSDCTINAGLSGFSCSGPALTQNFQGSCMRACNADSDCSAAGLTHAHDRCIAQQCMHSHDPALLVPDGTGGSAALDAVAAQFGRHGINLHIMRGQAVPHSHVVSFHLLNDPNNPANSLSDSCEGGSVGSGTAGAGQYAESFYDLKALNFDVKANIAYHYAIFGHYAECDSVDHCNLCAATLNPDGSVKTITPPKLGMSGMAEQSGNDLIVSLGNFIDEVGNPANRFDIGGTFMHELGHNLGLHHGGGFDADGTAEDTPNYKPNYLSVMNYNYQFVGIPTANACSRDADCADGSLCNGTSCVRLDYSTQVLPAGTATPGLLNENGALDETAGLGSGTTDLFFFTDGACNFRVAPTNGPVDWDGDGIAGDNSAATADLNPPDHPGLPCGSISNELLRGHADWGPAATSGFTYRFQSTSLVEDGAAAPVAHLRTDSADSASISNRLTVSPDVRPLSHSSHFNFQFQCTAAYQNTKP